MKISKQNYFTKYFESNLANIKNTWKDMISMRIASSITPILLTFQNQTINPQKITNIFNNYLSIIGKMTQAKMKYSYENYTDYLIMVVKFWDLLMFDQIFLSSQVKRSVIISNKHGASCLVSCQTT